MPRLDLHDLPDDPVERLVYLVEFEAEVAEQIESAYADTYYDLRFAGLLQAGFTLGRHGRKRILAFTRRVNHRRGSPVRWDDNLDGFTRR